MRDHGAVPATIAVIDGQARIGLTEQEITDLASSAGDPQTMKVSRRDLPYILGMVRSFEALQLQELIDSRVWRAKSSMEELLSLRQCF